MNKIKHLLFLFFFIISFQSKSQFFEYNNHLFSSKIALQDTSRKGKIGLDVTTNSKHLTGNTIEIGALYGIHKDKREINSLSIISNVRSYFNKSYYFEDPIDNEKIDFSKDGYFISVGLIYQFFNRDLKFSLGIAPTLSNYYQNIDAEIGLSSTLLFEYKRIMLITNLIGNQFNENFYNPKGTIVSSGPTYEPFGPYSFVTISSYFSSSLFFKLNPNSFERIYLKFLHLNTYEINKLAIGLSLPINDIVILNPEIAYNITESNFTSEKTVDKLYYGFLAKVKMNKFYIKSFLTYHKEPGLEDLNINLGIEYNL